MGCLSLLVICYPFFWAYDKCSGGDERRARETAAAEERASRERIQAVDKAARERALEAERKRRAEEMAAELAREETARLGKLKPYERAALLVKCVRDADCPLSVQSPDMILDAARTPAERKQLQQTIGQLERARERVEKAAERAIAPLLCRDGSLSPSCTCGNPKRGCCSHHGGVRGCSAD